MRFGSTLVLVGLAAALGAYVFWVDVPRQEAAQQAEADSKKLLEFSRDAVQALEMPLQGGGRARIERLPAEGDAASQWQIVEPLTAPAEEPSVTGLLTGFERLAAEFELEEIPEDTSAFGFDDAQRVRLEPKQGEALLVTLGGDTPVGEQRYVRLEGRRSGIFGVKKSQTSGLTADLYGLRDKRMIESEPDAVKAVRIRVGGELVVRAERSGETPTTREGATVPEWTLREPIEERGDADRLSRLVQDFYFARASDFVDAVENLGEYGVDDPQVEVELVTETGSELLKLAPAKEEVYLQVGDRLPLYVVPDRLMNGVGADLFDYRYKRIFTCPEDGLRRLEFLFPRDGQRFALVRGAEEDGWSPEGDWKLRNSLRPGDLLFALYNLDASALIEDPDSAALGLEPPLARITISQAEREVGWIELGDLDPSLGIAVRSSQSDRVWRIAKELAEDIPLGLEGFRNRWQLLEESPDAAEPGAPQGDATPEAADEDPS